MSAKRKKRLSPQISNLPSPPSQPQHINGGVVRVEEGPTDHLRPLFAFDFTDENRFHISDADKDYKKHLIKTLKTLGKLSWSEIKHHTGLQMKVIEPRHALPDSVSPEVDIIEFRVSNEGRLHGFRVNQVLQIIWFDPNHEVCPEGKIRR